MVDQQRSQAFLNMPAQRGAALVVALILLLVLTLIGVSTMESSSMEMKMANQSRERLIATQAAEAGLRDAESFIQATGFGDDELSNSGCTAGTQNCFTANCSDGGYCFDGSNAASVTTCTLTAPASPVWEDATLNVWSTAGRHHVLAAPNMQANVKYIVEFLCYIPGSVSDASVSVNPHLLFRITSLATTKSGKSRVMLQSTYKAKPF